MKYDASTLENGPISAANGSEIYVYVAFCPVYPVRVLFINVQSMFTIVMKLLILTINTQRRKLNVSNVDGLLIVRRRFDRLAAYFITDCVYSLTLKNLIEACFSEGNLLKNCRTSLLFAPYDFSANDAHRICRTFVLPISPRMRLTVVLNWTSTRA